MTDSRLSNGATIFLHRDCFAVEPIAGAEASG
jgi:hypothetical protein